MADALDQILADTSGIPAERQQRRVPAPQPASPRLGTANGGRPASEPTGVRPRSPGGGTSFLSTLRSGVTRALDTVVPGLGTTLGFVAGHPEETKAVGAGIVRSPVTAAAGVADLAGDVGSAISPKADIRNYSANISKAGLSLRYTPDRAERFAKFSKRLPGVKQAAEFGDESWNETSAQMASLAIGVGAAGATAKATGLAETINAIRNPVARRAAEIGAAAVGGGLVEGAILDPEAERLSNVLQQVGVKSEFVDYLAHDDKEGHWEGRFKNAVEGTLAGAAADSLFQAGRYWVKRLRGDTAAADTIQAELAAKHQGEELPDYIIEEHEGPLPAHDREPGFVGGWEEAEDGSIRPIYEQDPATAAQANTTTAPDGLPIPEGQAAAPIDPEQMAKIMGDPEAAGLPREQSLPSDRGPETTGAPPVDDTPTVTFTARMTPDDPPRVVGSVDRDSIKALGRDIEFWQAARREGDDRTLDVTREQAPETTADVGEFRLGVLGEADNVAPLLRAMVDRLPAAARRTDVDLMEAAARASNEIGEDPAALAEAARLIAHKLQDADTAMAVLRTVWVRAEKDIDEIDIPGLDWDSATDEQVETAAARIHNMLAISSHVQEAKAGLGRGLRVNQLPDADTYLNTVRKATDDTITPSPRDPGPLPRTRTELKDWMELWRSTKGDPAIRSALLEGTLTRFIPAPGKYLRSSFANFFTASILSAPRTLLLNLIGPGFMSVLRNTERLTGAGMAAVNPFLSATERANARAVARATVPAYIQTLGDISDVMRWAWKSAEENRTIIGGGGSIDAQTAFGPFTQNFLEAAGREPSPAYALGNLINMWPRAVARVNNGFDEFSKRLAYLGEVRVRALSEGIHEGLNGEELNGFVKQRLQSSVDEVGHATEDAVLREAERTTLTSQVGEPGGSLRGFSNWVQHLRRDLPESRYILPIFNVPANALGETLRRLPIAHMPGINRVLFRRTADELAGEYGPVVQADAHGRFLTGTAFMLSGFILNRMGLMTGAGPQDPTDRKVWLQAHQPYSIRLGDKWVRYDRYDVPGGLLSIPATLIDATQNVAQDNTVYEMMMSGAGSLAQWFKDRAALRSATGLLALGEDPTKDAGTVGTTFFGSVSAGFIPNAIQAMGTQTLDPYQRMRRSWSDYMQAAIPLLSAQLEPVRNVLGEPVNRPANSVGEGLFPVTIAPAVTFEEDPVIDELDRVYQVTGYGAGADPRSLGYGFFNPKDVQLENGRSLYDAFMQARLNMKVEGRTLREALKALFASKEYNDAVDADSSQRKTSLGDLSRGYMLKNTFETYNKAIKAELAAGSPIANKWLTAAAAKQRDDAYLRDLSAEDLVNNPDLYATRRLDRNTYSANIRKGSSGALLEALGRK